jgi:hypothetical protein
MIRQSRMVLAAPGPILTPPPSSSPQKTPYRSDSGATNVPVETVAHIQSAGCKAQKKSVIGAHNRCWKYLVGAITTHGEAKRDLEFIGGDKDRQLKKLWAETRIGSIGVLVAETIH